MSVQNTFRTWGFATTEALNDLAKGTGHIYKAVNQGTGKIANTGNTATGILQQGAPNTGHATLGYDGIMKFTASAAVNSAEQELTVTTSGYMKLADDGDYVVGRTLASVASGAVGFGIFNFSAPRLFGGFSEVFSLSAAADLSASTGLAVDFSAGTVINTSQIANGIVVAGTTSGGATQAKAMGQIAFLGGDTVTAGKSLKVGAGGYLFDAGSGDSIVGRATAAVSSGQSGVGMFNFATPHYPTSSGDGAL